MMCFSDSFLGYLLSLIFALTCLSFCGSVIGLFVVMAGRADWVSIGEASCTCFQIGGRSFWPADVLEVSGTRGTFHTSRQYHTF